MASFFYSHPFPLVSTSNPKSQSLISLSQFISISFFCVAVDLVRSSQVPQISADSQGKKMENEVSKLNLAQWNTQLRLENSDWLAENVKGLDQTVKEMLLLIEQDGDLSEKNVESDHPKHELVARMKEISHKHHLLADHYSKLTGTINGCTESANGMKINFDPELTPPFVTPSTKLGMLSTEGQIVFPDLSPSSGGGISDATPNGGSDSSILSSDSDSESFNSSPSAHSGSLQEQMFDAKKREYSELLRQISDYQKEVKISNEKLQFAEEEIAKLKGELRKNEAFIVKVDTLEAQLAAANNHIKLQEAEIDEENKRSLILQRQIVDMEAELESEKMHVMELQGSVEKHTTELSDCNNEIKKLNSEIQDASSGFALEKWQLESSISQLSDRLSFHEAKATVLQMQCDSLADEVDKHEAEKIEMERMHESLKTNLQEEIVHLKEEVCNKNKQLDGLKLKYDTLETEKDEAIAKLSACDDQIKHLEHNLQEVNFINRQLSSDSDSAKKVTAKLKSRVDELEKEVGMQTKKVNSIADEKREAIKQLCFSLDHFRNSYEEVRNAYVVMWKKRQ